jgi:hypothetical protein
LTATKKMSLKKLIKKKDLFHSWKVMFVGEENVGYTPPQLPNITFTFTFTFLI